MLLASAVDITIGWVWHTAYRARWHWKLKREGALIAAGLVAVIGAVDTARSLHGSTQLSSPVSAAIEVPAPIVASVAPAQPAPPLVASPAQAATQPLPGEAQQASAPDALPQLPLIQDQTGSIDPADPVETILPIDPAAQKDDPIARKINERYGDAADAPARRAKPHPAKTATTKPVKPAKTAKKAGSNSATE